MTRLEVLKTYKIYIGGKFPRTESGRYYSPKDAKGEILGNICLSSRKDFRNAVVAARGALGGWAERPAFNRGQILYRIAEMLEGRKAQFIEELIQQGSSKKVAEEEVALSITLPITKQTNQTLEENLLRSLTNCRLKTKVEQLPK